MKKLMSLILALVMVVSCMAGLAFAAELDEIVPSKAGWQAKTADGTAYYIKELDSVAMEWAIEQAGGVTFTALKGGVLFSADVTIPSEWDVANPMVIDLNGYSFTAEKNLNMSGDGNLTIKNGTVAINTNNNNRFISLGKSTAGNNNGNGHYFKPTLTLDSVYFTSTIPSDAKVQNVPMIESKMVHGSVTIKNSTLVSNVKDFYAVANFENMTNDWTFVIENSILVSKCDRIFRLFNASGATPVVNMTITNSAFASGTGNLVGGVAYNVNGNPASGNGSSAHGSIVTDWTGKTPDGTDLTAAAATVYGEVPAATTIPATVVIELPADPQPEPPPVVTPDPVDPPAVEPDPVDPPAVEPDPVDPPAVEPDPVDPPAVEPDPVDPPAVEPDPVDPPAQEPDTNLTPVVPVVEEEGPNMTLIIVIAAAAVVVVAAVVIIIVKKKKA